MSSSYIDNSGMVKNDAGFSQIGMPAHLSKKIANEQAYAPTRTRSAPSAQQVPRTPNPERIIRPSAVQSYQLPGQAVPMPEKVGSAPSQLLGMMMRSRSGVPILRKKGGRVR